MSRSVNKQQSIGQSELLRLSAKGTTHSSKYDQTQRDLNATAKAAMSDQIRVQTEMPEAAGMAPENTLLPEHNHALFIGTTIVVLIVVSLMAVPRNEA